VYSQFLRPQIGQITQLQIIEIQKRSKLRTHYFIFFLNFDMAKGEASAPLAPSLIAPLTNTTSFCNIFVS